MSRRERIPLTDDYDGPWAEPRLVGEIANELIDHYVNGTPLPPLLPHKPRPWEYTCDACGHEGLGHERRKTDSCEECGDLVRPPERIIDALRRADPDAWPLNDEPDSWPYEI